MLVASIYKPGVQVKPPETTHLTTLMKNKSTMEPLPINVSLNQEANGAIFHINCESDGKMERWIEGGEEASTQAKNLWLGKLGCLLKFHGDIECQWLYSSMETDTNVQLPPDIFHDPWAYKISDFPKNYKLFVEQQAQGGNPSRKDYYLYGMPFLSSFCVYN